MTASGEQAAFLRAICDEPADDTARLVYADWLEEHGERERAFYIRSEIGIWRAGGKSYSIVSSESPARRHYRPWMMAELDVFPFGVVWEATYARGFIEHIQ